MYRMFLCFITLIFVLSGLLFLFSAVAAAQETNGTYVELKNQFSGKCLMVRGASREHGAGLIHGNCEPGGREAIWEMRPQGEGYRLVNVNSDLCLGVAHQSKKDGEVVTQVRPCDRPDTVWKAEYLGGRQASGVGYSSPLALRNVNSGKCLALVTGTDIKQYGCPPHRPKTTWQFVRPSDDALGFLATGRTLLNQTDLFPFYLDGRTYIVSSSGSIWQILANPKEGFASVVPDKNEFTSGGVSALAAFNMNGDSYLFGRPTVGTGTAVFGRVGDDAREVRRVPATGQMATRYERFVSFQLGGKPYLLGLHSDVGANIWSIAGSPSQLTFDLRKPKQSMSRNYRQLAVFYLGDHPFIFGVHAGPRQQYPEVADFLRPGVGANSWRVSDNPADGLQLVMNGESFHQNYDFLSTFHLKGEPYIFAAKMIYPKEEEIHKLSELPGIVIDQIFGERQGYGVIWKIEGDPMKKLTLRRLTKKGIPISHKYIAMTTFEQGGKAYIFGIHEDGYANIWRVLDEDLAKGFTLEYYGKNPKRLGM